MSASLAIGALSSQALYVSGFVAEVYSDSGYTTKVGSAVTGAVQVFPSFGNIPTSVAITASTSPQSVQVTTLTVGGQTLVAGDVVLAGWGGSDAEIVLIDAVATVGSTFFVTAVFTQNHTSGRNLTFITGHEAWGPWMPTSVMVIPGLTVSTTYYVAAGAQSPGGAVNWSFYTATTAAAGTTFTGTYAQSSGRVITYTLTAASPPGDLTHYEAYFSTDYNVPVSSTTASWVGTGTSTSAVTGTLTAGVTLTTFMRAVGTSGNYPWKAIDQRVIAASSSSGAVQLGIAMDSLSTFTSGMDNTFPPPVTLINPSFEQGTYGWTLGTNWGIGEGHACFGNWSGFVAGTLGSPLTSSSSITNTYALPTTPGQGYFGQAMIDGSSATGGYGEVFIAFYNSSNVLLSTVNGNQVASGGLGWNLSVVQATAPSGSQYARVGCTVNGQNSGTVYVDDFIANMSPPGPVGVPSGPVFIKLANVSPDHNIHISTALNYQGSVLPNQPIPLTYTYTSSSIAVTCAPTTVLRADGSIFNIVGGTVTITGLTTLTTYYLYPFISTADGTLQFAGASLPSTSPNDIQAMQAESDGCVGLGVLTFTTTTTGSGVTGIPSLTLSSTTGSGPPTITISVAGDGVGAGGGVTWRAISSFGSVTFFPFLALGAGSGYTTATATVTITVATGGNPGYSSSTNTYACTLSASTGSAGGSTTCPEANELVNVLGKGVIKVGDVRAGDRIKGWSFQNGAEIYRRVVHAASKLSTTWQMVDGYRCSPTEPVYYDGQWMMAFRVPGATLDTFRGYKVALSVESDEYNEQNYYLVTGNKPLLIHNQLVSTC